MENRQKQSAHFFLEPSIHVLKSKDYDLLVCPFQSLSLPTVPKVPIKPWAVKSN